MSRTSKIVADCEAPKIRDVQKGVGDLDAGTTWQARATVPRPILVAFSRHLGTMLNSGIPLVRCLECLSVQAEAPNFGVVVEDVTFKVSSGLSLSESLRPYPKTFSSLYIGMVKVGEMSGQLTDALDRLGSWLERDDKLVHRIKQALTYPVLVLIASLLLTVSLFYFVVPQFLGIFVSLGTPLPWLTRVVLFFSGLAQNPGCWVLVGTAGAALYFLLSRMWATEAGRFTIFQILLGLPLIGKMLEKACLARFCSAAELALSNGLTVLASLEMAAQASASPLLLRDVGPLRDSLTGGFSLSQHLELKPDLYDPMLLQMVVAGEESARLAEAFARAAEFYDGQVAYLVDSLSAALEPILLVGVGCMVGVILLSVFLPMYSFVTAM